MLFSRMQGLPWACYKETNGISRCAIQSCNNFRGLGGPRSKPGGDILKKHAFLTYAGLSPDVLEGNQWYHRMRHLILQQLQGLRGGHDQNRGEISSKNMLFSLMQGLSWVCYKETNEDQQKKMATKKSIVGREEPLGTRSYQTSYRQSG